MTGPWDSSHPPARAWRRGDWSIELRGDELAEIRFRGRRVLRSIRAVVRDADWATAALTVEQTTETETGLALHVRTDERGASLRGTVQVAVEGPTLRVQCDLESAREFATNRTGLVVLHPMDLAGTALAVGHPDRTVQRLHFPRAISPHQPASDIASLAWEDDGLAVELELTGDVFEMEDQRNWSDASFKTYSRPLRRPFPYSVAAGERVRQKIALTVRELAPVATDAGAPRITLRPGGVFPEILVGAATAPDPSPAPDRVGGGVLVELDLASPNWRAALDRAGSSGSPLDVRVVVPSAGRDAALDALAGALRDRAVLRVAAFDPMSHVTDGPAAQSLRTALAAHGVASPVVGGARSHFTEFNRERGRIPTGLDGIVVATTPLFHSLDTEQLVEALAAQRIIAAQTVAMSGTTPVHIGPITLRPRFNNVATAPEPGPTRDDLAEGYGAAFTGAADDRQDSAELAAWTIASAAALSVPGVASLAWFEEWGPRGIRGSDGTPRPVAAAVRALAAMSGQPLRWGDSPDGRIWAVGSDGPRGTTILVANLQDSERRVEVDVAGRTVSVRVPGRAFVSMPPDAI